MGVLDYDRTPGNNTSINGIGIQGTSVVQNFDNALRQFMADMASYVTRRTTKAANYTAVKADNHQLIEFTAAATLSLTAAATLGDGWSCIVRANGGDVVIDPNSSETINGATTLTLKDGNGLFVFCNGTAFFTMGTLLPNDASAARSNLSAQAYHNKLQNLSGLTGGADKLPYFNGTDTWTATDFKAVGRALINPTGTAAADKIAYLTSASAAALTSLTSFARTLLDDADAETARSTLQVSKWPNTSSSSDGTTDFDDLTDPGWHDKVMGTGNPNIPETGYWFVLNLIYNSTNILQVAFPYATTPENGMRVRGRFNGVWSDWEDAVRPEALVVEEGSNSNGKYIRFGNGYQICMMTDTVTDQAVSNAYGSLYWGNRSWTFPASFSSRPSVTCSEFKWGSSASWGTIAGTPSTTSCLLRIFDISSRATGTDTNISVIATGEWS